jgi:hypothetical protein
MSDEQEPLFARKVASEEARKLRVQREGQPGRMVWPRHVRTDRLVGGSADAGRHHARSLARPAASGSLFLDARAAVCGTVYRLRECLVLGRPAG